MSVCLCVCTPFSRLFRNRLAQSLFLTWGCFNTKIYLINNFFSNIIVLEPAQCQKVTVCQRVSQSVSKWPRKKCTHTQTHRHFRIYKSRDKLNKIISKSKKLYFMSKWMPRVLLNPYLILFLLCMVKEKTAFCQKICNPW